MKKALLLHLSISLVVNSCNYLKSKNDKEFEKSSGIEIQELSAQKINDLKMLGMVWGFLKYYHPTVAKGDINWDFELFRVMPKILESDNKEERDKVFLNWIKSLREFELEDDPEVHDESDIKLRPDLDWINQTNFSSDLASKLNDVKMAEKTYNNHYVSLSWNVGNPKFQNEAKYESMDYTDTGYRLLALFRYWNMIQYFFPYKNLIEKDWKDVLEEFIPKLVEANNEIEYKLTIIKLIGEVHDSHAQYYGPDTTFMNYFGTNRIPVNLSFVEDTLIVTGYSHSSYKDEVGLEIGDVIQSVDGQTIPNILEEKLPLNPASNYATKLRNLSGKILRSKDASIKLEIEREGELMSLDLPTFTRKELLENKDAKDETMFKMLTPEIAYIHNGNLKKSEISELWEKFENTKGLVIDNRNYPGDFPIYKFGKLLVPEKTPFTKLTNVIFKEPGLFKFTKTLYVGEDNEDYYKGKVVILVNERTQSSAEFHAMAYRTAPNATVIGSTTAGADGNVSEIFLPGGIRTMISGIGIYYPDGSETQRVGIVPDIEVKPTIKGIRAGIDEVLEKAIELIETEK